MLLNNAIKKRWLHFSCALPYSFCKKQYPNLKWLGNASYTPLALASLMISRDIRVTFLTIREL